MQGLGVYGNSGIQEATFFITHPQSSCTVQNQPAPFEFVEQRTEKKIDLPI